MIRYEDSFTPSFAPSFTRCLGVRMPVVVGLLVSALLLMACNPMISGLSASERLEIETMVEDYFVAASSPGVDVPEYEARVEEVSGDWARVALWPVGVDNTEPNLFYLERQEVDATTPNQTPRGWTIVLGPQVHFTEIELDTAGVPDAIRP